MIALAWVWLVAGAGMSMSGIEMTQMSMGEHAGMEMMLPAPWSVGYALLMFSMWWIMMVAMMLPSAVPVILLAAAINRKARPNQPPYGNSAGFTLGYILGWGLFSLVAVAAQWRLAEWDLLSGALVVKGKLFSGGLMLLAAFWQFTPLKQACLRHCQSPVHFLTTRRRSGNHGALMMGLEHSLFCLGCCWFLMLLLFVGGVMNLFWVAGLALYVWLEKGLPFGRRLSQFAGAGLALWGIGMLLL